MGCERDQALKRFPPAKPVGSVPMVEQQPVEFPVSEYKGYKIVEVKQKGWRPWYRSYGPDGRIAHDYFYNLESVKQRIDKLPPVPATVTEPFPNTIQKGGKTYFFFKSYTTRLTLERDAERLQEMGYKTYVDSRLQVNALYTYPNYRFEERG